MKNLYITTITCHDVYNYGASLQAYALMQFLILKGHHVEIIDYKPPYSTTRYNFWDLPQKWSDKNILIRALYLLYKIPSRIIDNGRKRAFDKFTKSHLSLTSNRFHSLEDLAQNPPQADIYMAGSDQIWNTLYENGKDPSFYLDFAPDGAVKASYAASFSISEIQEDLKDFVIKMLQNFNFISVRENTGIQILKRLGIKDGKLVVDPVFLLKKRHWDKIASHKTKEKYILVYDFENNPLIEYLSKIIAKKQGLKIYGIKDYFINPYADVHIRNAGPQEFLGLIKNCEVFLSNSFHGTAFSIIYRKEFYVFNRMNSPVNSRMADLLKVLKIENRLIVGEESCFIQPKVDYEKVDKILDNLIIESKDFIDRVLKSKL